MKTVTIAGFDFGYHINESGEAMLEISKYARVMGLELPSEEWMTVYDWVQVLFDIAQDGNSEAYAMLLATSAECFQRRIDNAN